MQRPFILFTRELDTIPPHCAHDIEIDTHGQWRTLTVPTSIPAIPFTDVAVIFINRDTVSVHYDDVKVFERLSILVALDNLKEVVNAVTVRGKNIGDRILGKERRIYPHLYTERVLTPRCLVNVRSSAR